MIGFFIKKAFFDGWDNLIGLIILNVGFVLSLAVGYGAFLTFQFNVVIGALLTLLFLGVLNIFISGVSFFVKEYAFYQSPGFKDFWDYLKESLKPALFHTLFMLGLLIVAFFVIPFYAGLNGIVGAVVVALQFWVAFFAGMGLMYYFPIISQLGNSPKKAIKKCFLLIFDNIGFSIFLFLYTIINTIISILTAFLIPGFAAILMAHQDAVKLLMLKYDYLEENPDANRKKIPWSALLIEERDRVGHRSLRGMIFPWKE